MSLGLYKLDADGEPVECADTLEWAEWFETKDCRNVARDEIGKVTVSTVFLAIDHNFTAASQSCGRR